MIFQDLSGKTALVSGASGGLGLHFARLLARHDLAVTLAARRLEALEVAACDGIRVNALCPGYIETDINRRFFASEAGQALIRRIPQRQPGKPDELDGALLPLCAEAGSYITGSAIAIDGGHLVSSL
ncbi:MAG TPA: SDR family oxidoreductase [Nordella sp.]|nr:SDR family oxidoreductase [Nordella sp.]